MQGDKEIANMKAPIKTKESMSAAAAKAKKITVDVPRELYDEAEEIVHERKISTSVFVREAMEHHLADIKQKKLERELAEAYLATADVSARIHKEFQFVDAEAY